MGDRPEAWRWGGRNDAIDGVLLLYAKTPEDLARLHGDATALLQTHGHAVRRTIPFQPLPDKSAVGAKHEPFGFRDGISQPVMRGTYKALRGADPIHLVEAGEFILGYPDNRGYLPPSPTLAAIHDPASVLPVASAATADFCINEVNQDRDLGRNGSFLAIRQLEQHVDKFHDYCREQGTLLKSYFPPGVRAAPKSSSPPRSSAAGAWLAARALSALSGERRAGAGASVLARRRRHRHVTAQPGGNPGRARLARAAVGRSRDHGSVTPRQEPGIREAAIRTRQRFPVRSRGSAGAALPVRRAYPPRQSARKLRAGLAGAGRITNRHRIIRVGRPYEPETGQPPGLFFMCLNGDIERQFEFVQQTWIQNSRFHGLADERDPLIGERKDVDIHSVPKREGPLRLSKLPAFVQTLGGGYFFLPGRRTLDYLSS